MTAVCEVCEQAISRCDEDAECFQVGYPIQRARAEQAEMDVGRLSAELAAIRAEAAAQRPSAEDVGESVTEAFAGVPERVSIWRSILAELVANAILHERTVAAAARRPLVEALRFYASKFNWASKQVSVDEWEMPIDDDQGNRARAALAAAGEGK